MLVWWIPASLCPTSTSSIPSNTSSTLTASDPNDHSFATKSKNPSARSLIRTWLDPNVHSFAPTINCQELRGPAQKATSPGALVGRLRRPGQCEQSFAGKELDQILQGFVLGGSSPNEESPTQKRRSLIGQSFAWATKVPYSRDQE